MIRRICPECGKVWYSANTAIWACGTCGTQLSEQHNSCFSGKENPTVKPLLQCGHTANATLAGNKPICAICYGIKPGADEPCEDQPDLTGRAASCTYCKCNVPSHLNLPFFEYLPAHGADRFYCGCRGWD